MIRKCIKDYNKGEIKIRGRVYGYTSKVAKWMGVRVCIIWVFESTSIVCELLLFHA